VEERSVVESTAAYERWLASQIRVVADDVERKHRLMRRDAFTFLRATYYRFAERLPAVCPQLVDAPAVVAVGDLHVENFGTWRDREGRLVWGISDLDEGDRLPYTSDLARLAASALLAGDAGHLRLEPALVGQAILAGYTRGIAGGAAPMVLAERRRWLAAAIAPALPEPRAFWQHLAELPVVSARLPAAARAALASVSPGRGWRHTLHRRVAGVGSLGRPRLVALGDWQGGLVARELKALAPPATRWLSGRRSPQPPRVRHGDPWAAEQEAWLAQRLAPDTIKLDLAGLDRKRTDQRLLSAMGRETARLHLRSQRSPQAILDDLSARRDDWLAGAAEQLARDTQADYHTWCDRPRRSVTTKGLI
jgi:hypothetical protein